MNLLLSHRYLGQVRWHLIGSVLIFASLLTFKKNLSKLQTIKHLTSKFNKSRAPPYFTIRNRYISVLHARLRYMCSSLNNDLFRSYICDNPLCDLCGVVEKAIQYFFHHRKFTIERLVYRYFFLSFFHLFIN